MNLIIAIKKLTSDISQLSINRSVRFKSVKPGDWIQFRTGTANNFFYAVIDEIRNETVRLIMPRGSMPAALAVGDRIEALSVFQNPHLPAVSNQRVFCVAKGDGALLMFPLVKDLLSNGCTVSLLLSDGHEALFTTDAFRKSNSFKLIAIESASFFNHSLSSPIYNYILQEQPAMLYATGSADLTIDALKALTGGNEISSSVLCNALWNPQHAIRGLFLVNMHSKSKFIMVEGKDFSAVYQNEEQFIGRFGETASAASSKTSMKARMH